MLQKISHLRIIVMVSQLKTSAEHVDKNYHAAEGILLECQQSNSLTWDSSKDGAARGLITDATTITHALLSYVPTELSYHGNGSSSDGSAD